MTASGRAVQHKRQTVEASLQLSLSALHRGDLFKEPWREEVVTWAGFGGKPAASLGIISCRSVSEQPRVRLSYIDIKGWAEERILAAYTVDLTTTPCYFGGRRRWFRCPRAGCGQRVAKLYKPPGAKYFLCRCCHGLTYEGRQQHRGRMYEVFGRFGLYARRLEAARGQRQRLRWLLRLVEAREHIKVYNKTYQLRFLERLNRLRRGGDNRAGNPRTQDRRHDLL